MSALTWLKLCIALPDHRFHMSVQDKVVPSVAYMAGAPNVGTVDSVRGSVVDVHFD